VTMGKVILQFIAMAAIFFAAWFGLSRIDYVKIFHLNNLSKKTEKKLVEVIMKTIEKTHDEIDDDSTKALLDRITRRICEDNIIDHENIHVHLVESSDINAFALPGNHLIIYSGLIKRCDSVSELCGVMAHEIGHMQLNHVMKRLAGEMGIAVLASVATNGNSQVAAQIIKLLSSSAFERSQESDADKFAVDCLLQAHIDPRGFANFMMKIARLHDLPEEMEWISSHPDSKKRAEAIRAQYASSHVTYIPVISDEEWESLKDAARNN
jgi:beta-barrel assembly-enhancing protease